MPLLAYLDLTGHGTAQQVKYKGQTPIIGFNHQVDPQSTKIFVVRKKIDAQTPELYDFLTTGTTVPGWSLHLVHMPRSGPECNYLTMKLDQAKVAWINWVMPDLQIQGNDQIHEYEDVAFSYQTMSIPPAAKEE